MLAAWDRQILTNRHSLLEVEGELKGVSAGQEALERKLFLLETHQKVSRGADGLKGVSARQENLELRTPPLSPCPLSPPHLTSMRPAPRPSPLSGDPRRAGPLPPPSQEIHDALASIEGEAERICGLERGLLDQDALERDRLYARAEAISSALLSVGGDLQVCMCVLRGGEGRGGLRTRPASFGE